MNNLIKTSWINDIAKAHEIKEAIHPSFVSKLAQDVEQQVRRVIQDARVFQRRSKKSTLTVGDLNLALEANQQERIYGLGVIEDKLKGPGAGSKTESSSGDSAVLKLSDVLAKRRAPIVPLQPRVELHWLAVDGVQPLIPENPSSNRLHKTTRQSQAEGVSSASEYTTIPETFSREIQHFYARLIDILDSCDKQSLPSAYRILQHDNGLQLLLPYLSRFLCLQIKKNLRSLPHLLVAVTTIRCLIFNPFVVLDSHLEQLLPALLTTVIGSRLSSSSAEDHWSLRSLAADVVASTCSKYRVSFPDLHSQVCQTYTGQLKSPGGASSTTLPVVYSSLYGCIVGLTALGHTVTKTLLLTELAALEHKLFAVSPGFLFNSSNSSNKSNGNGGAEAYLERKRCLAALTIAVGKYIISSLRLYQSLPSSNRRYGKDREIERNLGESSLIDDLGEQLVPYYAQSSSTVTCYMLFI